MVNLFADFKEQEEGEKLPLVTHSCDVLITVKRKIQQIIKQFTERNCLKSLQLPLVISVFTLYWHKVYKYKLRQFK